MPPAPRILAVLVAASLSAPAGARADRTIAVMPFKNLSQAKGAVGEAIRETVTTDLKAVPGIKVIERSFIDKVIAEQNLVAQKSDLDPNSTVKVGKLLGAQLIVAGAYQEAGSQVRLTSRFVSVETGQIVGSAKVDGRSADFLSLQDRITTELLKSAGIAAASQAGKRTRPKVKSLRILELYGDALLATDDGRRRDLLQLAVAQEPDFVYAAQDLAALEERLKTYDRAAASAQARETKELRDKLDAEKDPTKKSVLLQMLIGNLQMARRYKQLAALCRWVLESPDLPPAQPFYPSFHEQALSTLVLVNYQYNDWDGVLREGERFVARFPQSNLFAGVRSQMDRAISEKHFVEEGKDGAKREIEGLSESDRKNPCVLSTVYTRNKQWAAARRSLESMKPGQCLVIQDQFQWLQVGMATGDFALTRKALADIKVKDPSLYNSLRSYETTLPE